MLASKTPCPDCGVAPDEFHAKHCDVEQCPMCGRQKLSCECAKKPNEKRIPWSGTWPGEAECREFGWFSEITATGRQKRRMGLVPDISRLYAEAKFDRRAQRFKKRREEE